MIPPRIEALVLAGARASGDPLVESEGVVSKAVIDIAGQPMLAHVLQALEASHVSGPFRVLGLDDDILKQVSSGVSCQAMPATGLGPASSLINALEEGVNTPVIVTTCDHALLTPAMVNSFVEQSLATGADMTVGLARRSVIEAAYPETRRTYLRLGGAEVSGCNLFYLARPQAIQVLRFWQGVEQDRKKPWRIARRFGLLSALRILLVRTGLKPVFRHLSQRLGADIRPVLLDFAEAAIDVDKLSDLELVRNIYAARAG